MFDMVGGEDSRFRAENTCLRKLWVYMENERDPVDPVVRLNKLAEATQEVADSVLSTMGLDRSMWTVSSMSLVFSDVRAKRGPPTVGASPPGYHAFVNLGCCLESLLLNQTGDSDEVEVLQALDFIGYKTDGLAPEVFLNRRPDVESWLYKVSRLILGPLRQTSQTGSDTAFTRKRESDRYRFTPYFNPSV